MHGKVLARRSCEIPHPDDEVVLGIDRHIALGLDLHPVSDERRSICVVIVVCINPTDRTIAANGGVAERITLTCQATKVQRFRFGCCFDGDGLIHCSVGRVLIDLHPFANPCSGMILREHHVEVARRGIALTACFAVLISDFTRLGRRADERCAELLQKGRPIPLGNRFAATEQLRCSICEVTTS